MVERYGIQDHDPQQTQHSLQNPTNQGNFQNISGAEGGYPQNVQYRGGVANFSVWSVIKQLWTGPQVPQPKNMVKAVLLALVFGPFGLMYASRIGALVMFGLTALAGFVRGGGIGGLDNDDVMGPLWKFAVAGCVAWAVIATRAFNARLKNPGGIPGVDKPL